MIKSQLNMLILYASHGYQDNIVMFVVLMQYFILF